MSKECVIDPLSSRSCTRGTRGCITLHVAWRLAETLGDAEVVRQIRNEGRSWFGDDRYVSAEDQQRWWADHKPQARIVLVGDPPVGYGMLSRREGRYWVSLAVTEGARGQGWGRTIYELLTRIEEVPIYAAIRVDNHASRIAAERAGFVQVAVDPPGVAVREDWIVLRFPGVQQA